MRLLLLLLLLIGLTRPAQAQGDSDPTRRPTVEVGEKGILVRGTDPFAYVAFRFRVQQLASATSESDDDLSIAATQFAVRRMRLRIESVLVDPRLKVNIQLSFSRGDRTSRPRTSRMSCAMRM